MYARLTSALALACLISGASLAAGSTITDPQIAHIAYTAGVIDIEAAKQALKISKDKDVIAFANDMLLTTRR